MSERVDQVRALAGQGMSASKIARATGSTRDAIAGFCHRNGIRLHGQFNHPGGRHLHRRSKFRDQWLEDDPLPDPPA